MPAIHPPTAEVASAAEAMVPASALLMLHTVSKVGITNV